MSVDGRGLLERLRNGESIVIAEGYMFEIERRGYLSFGPQAPEVVLEHPEKVRELHEEFVHAGSDVVQAFTYYANKEKMRLIGRCEDMKLLNMKALQIAKEVAKKHGKLLAAGLCNSTTYDPDNQQSVNDVSDMFKEQVEWFVEGGCDYIIGETFNDLGEAMLALNAIKRYGKGLPAVITLVPYSRDVTIDGVLFPEACRQLEEAGAAVVGLNCSRGPRTMLPLVKEIKKVCKGPLACLPVVYRTDWEHITMQALLNPETENPFYLEDISMFQCPRSQITSFAEQAKEAGVEYVGLCCGNSPHYTRILADVYGRDPPANRYKPNPSMHPLFTKTRELSSRSANILKCMTEKA